MWDDLDGQTQDDLFEWFNMTEISDEEKEMLAALFESDQFNWGNYQGVRQADFCSYPGDITVYQPEYIADLCDHCRRTS